jgi:dipeptidyl aminopeptidase/acylaminoacyl peptidase
MSTRIRPPISGTRLRARVIALAAMGAALLASTSATLAQTAPATAAPAKAPITHEDVWLMKRVGGPAISPDGKWTEPAYDDKQVSDLWVVATDGSGPARRLTSTAAGESGVDWSPDSTRIAFSARRDGDEAAQIYVLDLVRGGEAQRVTALSTGARAPSWSPDGRAMLFTSDVYPGAATDAENQAAAKQRKDRKHSARVYDDFPIRHWDRWLDDRRPSLFVVSLQPGAEPRDLLAGSSLVKGAGFGGQLGNSGEELPATWTPDGQGVVFAATANRNAAAYADPVRSLWLVPVAGGEPQRLTTDEDSYASPVFSPDGRTLFAHMEPSTDRTYNATRLVSWSWPSPAARKVVTPGFDRSVGSFAVAPGGGTVYLLAEDAGREKLYSMPASGGAVGEVGALEAGCYTNLAVGGGPAPVIVSNWESAVAPPEVVRIDTATGKATPLTRFNAERVEKIDWQPVREFWFTSSRGKQIHSFLALPPGFDPAKKYPLFVLIHGGPHGPWRDQFVIRWNYHLLAAPGYVVLLTNYTGSTSFGEKFAQDIQGDPLEGPAREINEAADAAIARFPFVDAARQVAGGASYGGHLTNWLAVTTKRYKALVSHAGLFDLKTQWLTSDVVYSRERNMGGPAWEDRAAWKDQSPFYKSPNLHTPILVTVGERDFRVPVNNALEFWSVLRRQRVPSRLIVFPDENHWILKGENSRFFYREVLGWVAKWLGTPAPSRQ